MSRSLSRPRSFGLAIALAAGLGAPLVRGQDDLSSLIPNLKVEKYTLPNGLDVILHEDHTTPVVGVNIWYKVGSQDEKTGRTGFAHLFEHLMFQGSQNRDTDYPKPILQVGGTMNGSTNTDRTNYFEVVPSNALERILWLEADRMGFLLPALSQEKLDNQRDVVKNERRQRVDNVPYGLSFEIMSSTMYPPGHPYHHTTIGSMADLSAASLADVSNFFRTYYSPNNASLAIAGDFNPADAKRLVEKYFGPLPKGPEVKRPEPRVPVIDESKHVKITDRVQLTRASIAWPTVPVGHEDEDALDLLAVVLGGLENENRLFKALMYDNQLATQASAFHPTRKLAGEFMVTIMAQRGKNIDDLVKIADAEIERLKKDGPTEAELRKAKMNQLTSLVVGLQSVQRKSDFLNQNNVTFDDPLAYRSRTAKLLAVKAADLVRVANKYLSKPRVRLDVSPGAQTPRPPEVEVDRGSQAPSEAPSQTLVRDAFDRSKMPELGPPPKFTPPAIARRKLSNGLEVLIAERRNLPIIGLNLVVKGGETLTPGGKEGLASLASRLMTEGTESRDAIKLAGDLAEIGASLNASSGLESSGLTLTALSRNIKPALELYADVLLRPSFVEKELNRLRTQRLAALMRRKDDPEAVSDLVFPKLLYGDAHPYGRPEDGDSDSIKSLTREDVVRFHQRLFVPNNATLIAVGDVSPDEIVDALESALKDWKPGEPVSLSLPETPKPRPTTIYLVDKPGAAQSVIAAGQIGLPRSTPDYFPIQVMNYVLGAAFSSRINMNLREQRGYTYGARSTFSFRQGPGPFSATSSVRTSVTKEALIEIMKELSDIRGPRAAADSELAYVKEQIVKLYPSRFETLTGMSSLASTLADLVTYNLPADYFATYQSKVESVSKADVDRVAKQALDPEHMVVLIVGDRAVVEPTLKGLDFAKEIVHLDTDGKPLASKPAGE